MSSPLSESMEQILDRFDDAWNGPSPPSIEAYLRVCEPAKRRALLIELIYIDLERRLAAGEPVRVDEVYLRRFPVLNDDRAAVVALAAREFELRLRREPNLSPSEYLERWPDHREELAPLLCSHPTVSSQHGETCNGKAPVDDQQASEETRDVFAILTPPQAADEMGRLAGYRALKVLGSGGMGVVFLAEDAQLQRKVALKIMRPGLASNNAARQRFLREARAVAALKHDCIVTIYQVGEDRGVPFLAMEYLEGETLHERLKREKVLSVVEALRLGGEIAEALAAAHTRGVIHRDVKPGNIWLEHANRSLTVAAPKSDNRSLTVAAPKSEPRPSGSGAELRTRVKLLDFGLARSAGGEDAHLTQTGVILGTPAFMSPEQARGEKVDPRSDLFSLGCVLYRMVAGELPFQGRDMVSTLLSLANDHPKPPRQLNPKVPPTLNNLIQRLLAKSTADRPPTAAAVVAALRAIEEEWSRPVPALPVADTLPLPIVVATKRPRRRLALAAPVVFAMAVLLGAIIIRIRGKDGRETTIEAPEGSKVTIEEDGKVAVELSRDRKGAVVPPLIEGTEALGSFALVRRPARLKGVRSWTIETRGLRGGSVTCAMRPDGRQLAVCSFDGVIRLYDPSTGRLQCVLYGQQKGHHVSYLTWSPDGKRLTSHSDDNNTLHIRKAATEQILRTIQTPGTYGGPSAWSPDGKLLAVGTDVGMTLWNTESWRQVPFSMDARNVRSLAWSPDSKMLAAGGGSPKLVWLWEVPSGKLLRKFELCEGNYPSLAWSPDGTILVSEGAGSTKELRVWDAHSGKLLRTLELQAQITTAAYSPDGKILAVGTGGIVFVQLFDTGSWKPLQQLRPGVQDHISSIAWSPDGATLAAACYQGHVSIFDVKTGKEVRRIEAFLPIRHVAWSADDKKISLPCGWEGFRIWDVDSGTQLRRIEGYANSSSWSPTGKTWQELERMDLLNNMTAKVGSDCDPGQHQCLVTLLLFGPPMANSLQLLAGIKPCKSGLLHRAALSTR